MGVKRFFKRNSVGNHDARAVADELLRRAKDEGKELTPLQVIKLVYLCQGWMLGIYGEPFFHQPIEAWRYGPVIRDVYDSLKHFGNEPVSCVLNAPFERFSREEKTLIDRVLFTYGDMDGLQLSRLTHLPDTPWDQTYRRLPVNSVIPNKRIKEHYEKHARREDREDSESPTRSG